MNRTTKTTLRLLLLFSAASIGTTFAQDYDIDWWTIDGGGDMWCSGGDESVQFELSGTIGQHDANLTVLTGGNLELAGGFWAAAAPAPPEWCLGDMNCSGGAPEFMDINYFVTAIGCESCWHQYYRDRHDGEPPPCYWLMGDYPDTPAGVEFQDIVPFANSIGQPCTPYTP